MDVTLLEDTLHSLMSSLTAKTVIYEESSAPRPDIPYLSMKVLSARRIATTELETIDAGGIATFVSRWEATLSIKEYGPNSLVNLVALSDLLSQEDTADSFRAGGLIIIDAEGVTDITTVIDTKYEKRGNLDVLLRFSTTHSANIGFIGTVRITESYKDANGNVVFTETNDYS